MKTEEQIFNTDEEAFKAIDEYVKKETIAFLDFIRNNYWDYFGREWCGDISLDYTNTNEQLYLQYLKYKTNKT